MKLVVALIRPEQLPAIKQSLHEAQFQQLTAMSVMGTAPRTEQQMYRGVERKASLFRRVRVEVAVQDSQVDAAIKAIESAAKETGGWGRIIVIDLHDAVRIWTGERGEQAI